MRRTLTIVAAVVVIVGIAVAAWFFFFRTTPSVTVGTPNPSLPGSGTVTPPSGDGTLPTEPAPSPTAVTARLMKITDGPVVPGEIVISQPAADASSSPTTLVKFVRRESGNIYSYQTATKTLTRTSNKTIPGVQSATWLPDGSLAYLRYLTGADANTINTYGLPASGDGGFFLAQNLADIAVSSSSVLSLASGVSGSAATLSKTDGSGSVSAFTTPLSAVRAQLAGKRYLVFTKPASSLAGAAFLVDPAGRFSRVAGPLMGLAALASPSGTWLLVSSASSGVMRLQLVNTVTGETLPLPVATIADKCVWASDESAVYCGVPVSPPSNAAYPDDWYQGAVSFSDKIWKFNVAARFAELVLDFKNETKGDLDATALAIDGAKSTLVFVNKSDGSLWSFSL